MASRGRVMGLTRKRGEREVVTLAEIEEMNPMLDPQPAQWVMRTE